MSEQENNNTTPPKPKVGSLRDRIAAFEKSAQHDINSSAQKPLAPRSKPGPSLWKPTPPSSSSKDDNGDENSTGERKHHGGMSADDAKESIAAGGGLKARMAALQGNMNAHGGSPPAASPPISKPLRKPFVPRPPTPDEDGEEGSENKEKPQKEPLVLPRRRLDGWDPLAATVAAASARQMSGSPPVEGEKNGSGDYMTEPSAEGQTQEKTQEQEQEQEQDEDEETKERERRAALAARMARLGGARIGMAPPIIPKKPKPARSVEEESHVAAKSSYPTPVRVLPVPEGAAVEDRVQSPTEVKETESDTLRSVTDEASSRAAPLPPTSPLTSGDLPEKRSSSFHEDASSSQTSLASYSSPSGSIPLPALPRRAAPPRSKNSTRSVKSEQSSLEPDHPETKITEEVSEVEAEKEEHEAPVQEATEAVHDMSIAEDSAVTQEEEHHEVHEEDDLVEDHDASSRGEETVHAIELNADHEGGEENEEEVEEKFEEVEAVEEEKVAEPEDVGEDEGEGTEEAEDHASHHYTPGEEEKEEQDEEEEEKEKEETPPPPPPRRQQSSHSATGSFKASNTAPQTSPNVTSPNERKQFFHDTADDLEDS